MFSSFSLSLSRVKKQRQFSAIIFFEISLMVEKLTYSQFLYCSVRPIATYGANCREVAQFSILILETLIKSFAGTRGICSSEKWFITEPASLHHVSMASIIEIVNEGLQRLIPKFSSKSELQTAKQERQFLLDSVQLQPKQTRLAARFTDRNKSLDLR